MKIQMSRQEARAELRKKRSKGSRRRGGTRPVLSLDPELCKTIVAAGGPTFQSRSRGFRCNQTGAFVRKPRSYVDMVFGMAVGGSNGNRKSMAKAEAKAKAEEVERQRKEAAEAQRIAKLPRASLNRMFGEVECPYCHRNNSGVTAVGRRTCQNIFCGREFRVV